MTTKTLTDQEDLLRLLTKFGLQVEVLDAYNEIDIHVDQHNTIEFYFDPDGEFQVVNIDADGRDFND